MGSKTTTYHHAITPRAAAASPSTALKGAGGAFWEGALGVSSSPRETAVSICVWDTGFGSGMGSDGDKEVSWGTMVVFSGSMPFSKDWLAVSGVFSLRLLVPPTCPLPPLLLSVAAWDVSLAWVSEADTEGPSPEEDEGKTSSSLQGKEEEWEFLCLSLAEVVWGEALLWVSVVSFWVVVVSSFVSGSVEGLLVSLDSAVVCSLVGAGVVCSLVGAGVVCSLVGLAVSSSLVLGAVGPVSFGIRSSSG